MLTFLAGVHIAARAPAQTATTMQLRHMKTVQPAAEGEGVMQRVTALTWAPNNMRLAAVTTDRIVHLFDENGERRDKFSTKPADSKVRRCMQTRGAAGAAL